MSHHNFLLKLIIVFLSHITQPDVYEKFTIINGSAMAQLLMIEALLRSSFQKLGIPVSGEPARLARNAPSASRIDWRISDGVSTSPGK